MISYGEGLDQARMSSGGQRGTRSSCPRNLWLDFDWPNVQDNCPFVFLACGKLGARQCSDDSWAQFHATSTTIAVEVVILVKQCLLNVGTCDWKTLGYCTRIIALIHEGNESRCTLVSPKDLQIGLPLF